MDFSSLTLFMTEDCNFNCSYCFQIKGKQYLKNSMIEKAVDFFLPLLTEKCFINFYGGEPLLAYGQIQHAVDYLEAQNKGQKREIQYTMTTNGSLLDDDILQFLSRHKFSVMLSFDGMVQDISRKERTSEEIASIMRRISEYPQIDLETNSVFTPETIGYLSKSMQLIMELGVSNIRISISHVSPWKPAALIRLRGQLELLRRYTLSSYHRTGKIPLRDFSHDAQGGIFACFAGEDRLAMTTNGKLWGCHLFADYFKRRGKTEEYHKYCFGDLEDFIQNSESIYPEILSNYSDLRMDNFYTPDGFCLLCDDLEECRACPVNNKFAGTDFTEIPSWVCHIRKIFTREKELFWKELESEEGARAIKKASS